MTLVVAMGDDVQHLEQTLDPLFNSYNVDPDNVEVLLSPEIYDTYGAKGLALGNLRRVDNGDVVSELKGRGIPERDAMFYAQGLRQGKDIILVDVEQDLSERVASYFQHNRLTETSSPSTTSASASTAEISTAPATSRQVDARGEETFEVIEENLKVGARTIEKGGVKVEKTVERVPVEEEIRLKEEHAVIHRQPVNRAATSSELESAFSEETIEVREFAQEAVVEKEARVVEEVTVGKYAEEKVEKIRDELKRIDVNIERIDAGESRWAYDTFRPQYLEYHASKYSPDTFDRYEHAYRFGHAYALDDRTRTMSYGEVEPHMRKDWEGRYEQSAWEDFKDSVSHAWYSLKAKFD